MVKRNQIKIAAIISAATIAMTGCSASDLSMGLIRDDKSPIIPEEQVQEQELQVAEAEPEVEIIDEDAALLRVVKGEGSEEDYLLIADYYIDKNNLLMARDVLLEGAALFGAETFDEKLSELIFDGDISSWAEKYVMRDLNAKLENGGGVSALLEFFDGDMWKEVMLPEKKAGYLNNYLSNDGQVRLYVSSGYDVAGEEFEKVLYISDTSYIVMDKSESDCRIIQGKSGIDARLVDATAGSTRTAFGSESKLSKDAFSVWENFINSAGFSFINSIFEKDYSGLKGQYTMWVMNPQNGNVIKVDGDFSGPEDTSGLNSEGIVFIHTGNSKATIKELWGSRDGVNYTAMKGTVMDLKESILESADMTEMLEVITKEGEEVKKEEIPVNTPAPAPAPQPQQPAAQPQQPAAQPQQPAAQPQQPAPQPTPTPTPTPDPTPAPAPDPAPTPAPTPTEPESEWTPTLS